MSPATKHIQIRVTPEQYERIRNKAQAKGYKTITAYLVHMALERDLLFEQRFEEMYNLLKHKLGTRAIV